MVAVQHKVHNKLFKNVTLFPGKTFYDEEWKDRTVHITVKTDLNFNRKMNAYQFDRTLDCPKVLKGKSFIDRDKNISLKKLYQNLIT